MSAAPCDACGGDPHETGSPAARECRDAEVAALLEHPEKWQFNFTLADLRRLGEAYASGRLSIGGDGEGADDLPDAYFVWERMLPSGETLAGSADVANYVAAFAADMPTLLRDAVVGEDLTPIWLTQKVAAGLRKLGLPYVEHLTEYVDLEPPPFPPTAETVMAWVDKVRGLADAVERLCRVRECEEASCRSDGVHFAFVLRRVVRGEG